MKTISVGKRWLLLVCLVVRLIMPEASAQGLAKPKGPVVLTVSGLITQHNVGATAAFDLAMLSALPQSLFWTKTPWQDSVTKFSGPSLRTLLAALGATGQSLRLFALDKYEANMPMSDVTQFEPLLAWRVDDKPLMVRTRGPLLVMYPFDRFPEINTEIYAGRSVWQLQRIVVQ